MQIADIQLRLEARRSELARLGVTGLHLFGSTARGEARDDSDIDLIVAFDRQASFDAFMDLKFLLEDTLGRSIDLVTETAIRPSLKSAIDREAVRVA